VPLATGLGGNSAVHLEFAPHRRGKAQLFYTTYAGGGSVRRIRYVNAPPPSTGTLEAVPTSGPAPLTVTFDASAGADPDGDALTYLWTFGDRWTARTSGPTAVHTYTAPGTYIAGVRVRDTSGATSPPASVVVSVGAEAAAGIVPPPPGAAFVPAQLPSGSGALASASSAWAVTQPGVAPYRAE
jgi:PKD repeat protein